MKARVYVTLKKSVLDPQGQTVQSALKTMGFDDVKEVRCGKLMEVTFKEAKDGAPQDKDKIERDLKAMCEKLLANTVIEEFRWEVAG